MEKLPGILRLLFKLWDSRSGLEYIEAFLRYLSSGARHLNKQETLKTINSVFEEGGHLMSTLAEQWIEEGIERGMKKGIEKGMKIGEAIGEAKGEAKGIVKSLLTIIGIKFGASSTMVKERVSHLTDVEKLAAIHRQAVIANSAEEFEAYLNKVIGEAH
jgi:hypothetical protein